MKVDDYNSFLDVEMEKLRENYKLWKNSQRDKKEPFFIIYKSFSEENLNIISGGALKLYVFLGFNVNTFTGECWISIEKIGKYFGNDPRTIKKWFRELESLGLICRIQKGYKRVANTFLIPYGK